MTTPDHASRAHARLSPSAAHRWTVCTASVGFIEANKDKLPDDSSVYADEGTKAHELSQLLLQGEGLPMTKYDAEMVRHVKGYVEFVKDKMEIGDRLHVEYRTQLFYNTAQKGTADVVLLGKNRIAIIDLKYGAGVSVFAEENKQLAIYAESVVRELCPGVPDDFLVELYIYQPRDRNHDEPVREWRLSRRRLAKFCKAIEDAARTITVTPHLTRFHPDPEKACRFCPAAGICHARGTHGLQVITDEPVDVALQSELRLPDAQSLTREQRQRILQHAKGIKSFLDAVEEQEVHELSKGAPPMLFKLVEGKSNRKWVDEATATIALSDVLPLDDIAPRSLISPAQAEKLLSPADRKQLANLIVKPPGAPTLVPVSDKRPALEFNPTAGLEDLSDVI